MHSSLVILMWIDDWSGCDDIPRDLETVDLPGYSHMSTPAATFRQELIWRFGV